MFALRLRFWLPIFSILLVIGSASMLAWAMLVPCRIDVAATGSKQAKNETATVHKEADDLSMAKFEPLLKRRLQAPLFDPPPPTPAPVVKKELPPPPVKLLATMPEPKGGRAMFSDAGGSILIKSVGDQVNSGEPKIEIVEIANDHVVLRQEDQLVTLKLPQ